MVIVEDPIEMPDAKKLFFILTDALTSNSRRIEYI